VRLSRRISRDLPSEGLVRGAVQVPPDSDPVMMLADHPTTGGYPVIAVVHPDDVALVAQTPPGGSVRFTEHLAGSATRR
jgi:allophanate hydrolase subunit 2